MRSTQRPDTLAQDQIGAEDRGETPESGHAVFGNSHC